MIWFGLLAALFIAGALAFVLPPLLRRGRGGSQVSRGAVNVNVYRDQLRELENDLAAGTLSQDRYDEARREIERQLLEDTRDAEVAPASAPRPGRLTAVIVGAAVPLVAIGLYFAVGNPDSLVPERVAGAGEPHGVTQQQVEAMIEQLAARLRANPDDPQGWRILARSYAVLGRFKESVEAYANAAARTPNDAQLLADYADALGMAQGRNLEGEPEKLIARALAIDPANTKALALAATAAFNRRDYANAVQYWERMLTVLPPDSEAAQVVRSNIAEARSLAGGALAAASPAAPAPALAPAPADAGGRVSGVVKLAPELAGKIAPTDTVFVFARAAQGPRMPLAILRRQARDLPLEFTLDDSMAMTPAMKLSSFPQVVIGARVSKSANAVPQPGDLQGLSAPIQVGANGVSVVIDSEVR
ncbi:MAG: c-type cytochrome biogenesis protein CcmI [Betaproteobacteria bacterium]|nr:c-type cytochrome biogenesis protein CcmI [Betaproteobacteria bacterium]